MTSLGIESQTETAALSNRLFFKLYQCANMLHKTGTNALQRHGVTTQQWAVLGALSRPNDKGGLPVGELAAYLMVSRQNLAGVLKRLEALGHVERVVDRRDSRSRLVRLTRIGQSLWATELQPDIAAFYTSALDSLSATDRIHAIHYLDKLLDNFRRLDRQP